MKHPPIINFCYWKAYVHSAYPQGGRARRTRSLSFLKFLNRCGKAKKRVKSGMCQSHEELETLQSYDKLEVKVERLVRDVLVQKALKNSFRYKL